MVAELDEVGTALGREALAEVATLVKPGIILAWQRRLMARRFDGSINRKKAGSRCRLRPGTISRLNSLPQPVRQEGSQRGQIPKRLWPEVRFKERRDITSEEHQLIIEWEKNPERRGFYELCWHLGGSQTDIVNLKAEDIDWSNQPSLTTGRKPAAWP